LSEPGPFRQIPYRQTGEYGRCEGLKIVYHIVKSTQDLHTPSAATLPSHPSHQYSLQPNLYQINILFHMFNLLVQDTCSLTSICTTCSSTNPHVLNYLFTSKYQLFFEKLPLSSPCTKQLHLKITTCQNRTFAAICLTENILFLNKHYTFNRTSGGHLGDLIIRTVSYSITIIHEDTHRYKSLSLILYSSSSYRNIPTHKNNGKSKALCSS
jgi:hypothetical protein